MYCGIDKYISDESFEDMGDHIECKEMTNWFKGKTLNEAIVTSERKSGNYIKLCLNFTAAVFQ